MRHSLWHIVGCLVPLLLIFLLPIVGLQGQRVTLLAFVAMFACHFLMMRGSHDHASHSDPKGGDDAHQKKREAKHGCH